MTRLLTRSVTVIAMLGAAVLVTAAPAAAHITVHATDAVPGETAAITLRVPNESETAKTSKIHVQLPREFPFEQVAVRPHVGWTVGLTKVDSTTLVADGAAAKGHGHGGKPEQIVSEITWTATDPDAAIRPGEYDDFEIKVGPLPTVDRLEFKAVQTYDDGQVDRWIEPASGDGTPGHPAPVLRLRTDGGGGGPAGAAATTSGTHVALWLAAVSLLVAMGAVAVAVRFGRPRRGGTGSDT